MRQWTCRRIGSCVDQHNCQPVEREREKILMWALVPRLQGEEMMWDKQESRFSFSISSTWRNTLGNKHCEQKQQPRASSWVADDHLCGLFNQLFFAAAAAFQPTHAVVSIHMQDSPKDNDGRIDQRNYRTSYSDSLLADERSCMWSSIWVSQFVRAQKSAENAKIKSH